MKASDNRKSSAPTDDQGDLRVTAVLYRVRRLLLSEAEARTAAGTQMPLIERWHQLQAMEAKVSHARRGAERRLTRVHRAELRAARRRDAASCPLPHLAAE